jgi:hypothetical protein
MNALDECPDTSDAPSPRNRILQLLEELAGLPNLRICVTSRPEFVITGANRQYRESRPVGTDLSTAICVLTFLQLV